MKKGTKFLTLFMTTAVLLSLFAIIGVNTTSTPLQTKKVAIVYATGGLGDKSFNDAAERGKIQAETEFGSSLNVVYSEPEEIAVFSTHQSDFASPGDCELIICIGFLQWDALNITADIYPDQRFTIIDSALDKPNVSSITFKEHEGSFLVGAMAAMTTATDKIGFLGGMDIYLINKFLAGYQQGAQFINPDIEITAVYSPDPTNPWGDIAGGKSVGETLFAAGNDVVYTAAGGTGQGVMQAANESSDTVYAIGVDSDQDYLYPGKVLCSMLKLVETAVYESITAIMDDSWDTDWAGDLTQLGLKEGGVSISDMTYTQPIKNGNFVINGITKTRGEWIDVITEMIVNGTIFVSETPAEVTIPCGFSEGDVVAVHYILTLYGYQVSGIEEFIQEGDLGVESAESAVTVSISQTQYIQKFVDPIFGMYVGETKQFVIDKADNPYTTDPNLGNKDLYYEIEILKLWYDAIPLISESTTTETTTTTTIPTTETTLAAKTTTTTASEESTTTTTDSFTFSTGYGLMELSIFVMTSLALAVVFKKRKSR